MTNKWNKFKPTLMIAWKVLFIIATVINIFALASNIREYNRDVKGLLYGFEWSEIKTMTENEVLDYAKAKGATFIYKKDSLGIDLYFTETRGYRWSTLGDTAKRHNTCVCISFDHQTGIVDSANLAIYSKVIEDISGGE